MANFPETQELLGTFICLKSTHAKLVPNGLEPAKVLPIAALLLASSQTVTNKLNERSEEKLKKIFRTLKSVTIKADIFVPLIYPPLITALKLRKKGAQKYLLLL